ncbi:hypothetical protein CORC01_13578 [Colletotrichum orchidophilum]|uniref:Uncharacterized protein n=1 Tax=Colletotrichum orchidophilum TaxID=1209926 RepID=A0A1G4APV6_9PEZI|nr:uncharacterized protein CORC01_13578 [Colletotrichum orchidophilum]OHE91131.1 hypothetical protein CORC01_13578 [Colletotrichum orchidophilum]
MGHSTGRKTKQTTSRSSLIHTPSSHTSLFDVLCAFSSESEPGRTFWTLALGLCSLKFSTQLATCAKYRQASPRRPTRDDGFRGRDSLETRTRFRTPSFCFSDYAVAHFTFLALAVVDKSVRSLIKGKHEESGPVVDPACHYRKVTHRSGIPQWHNSSGG